MNKYFEAIIVKLISTGLATLKFVFVCVSVCKRERERKESWIADETPETADI